MKTISAFAILAILAPGVVSAIDLKQAKFTQVVNDVKIISGSQISPAEVNSVFNMPDVLRTGPGSRAELVAADDTITRVGANTIFSFDPAERTIDLQQGSLLFHSPHGKGGGTIRTATATASVLGTTLIASTTPNGGLKVLDLEGSVEIRFLNGLRQHLEPGQMTFILPGGRERAPIILFRLDQQTKTSKLVSGFKTSLTSLPLINRQIANQLKLIRNGQAADTSFLVGEVASANQVQVVDANSVALAVGQLAANSTPPPSAQPSLLNLDAVINSSTLDPNNIYVHPGFDITTDPNNFLGSPALSNPFYGFPAYDITINTPTLDLSAYANSITGNQWFDIVALNDMDITGSLTVTGLSSSDELYLSAGNQLTVAPGSTVTADIGLLQLSAFQPIVLDNVGLANSMGDIRVEAPSGITLENNASITAGSGAYLYSSDGGVDIDSSSINASYVDVEGADVVTINDDPTLSSSGNIDITSDNSSVDINQSTLTAGGEISLDASGGPIDLERSTFSAGGEFYVYNGGALTMGATAGDTVTAGGEISLDASGGPIDLEQSTFSAGGEFYVYSGGALTMGATAGDTVTAGGEISLDASGGPIDLEQSTFSAGGEFYVYSGGALTMGATAGDAVTTGGEISLEASGGPIDLERSSFTAGGEVYIYSGGALTLGDVINDSIQSGAGTVLEAAGGIIDYSTPITDSSGDGIEIDSTGGTLDVENCGLSTSGDIAITSYGALELGVFHNLASYAASQLFSGYDVNITSTGGAVSIYTTDFTAGDDITVNSVGTLTVDALLGLSETPDTFTAVNNISLTSSAGDVDLYDTTSLITTSGSVSVSAEGTVNVDDVSINAAGGISLVSSPVASFLVPSPTGDVDVEDSATLTATSGDIDLTANAGNVNLSDSILTAVSGNVDISAGGTVGTVGMVNINDMTISAANSAGAAVSLSGVNGVTISDSTITADPVNGTVNINSSSSTGTITVENSLSTQTTTLQAGTLTLNSGDGILLDGSTGTLNLNSSGGNIDLTVNQSGGLISVYDVNLTGYGAVNMSSHTLVLQDVTFALTSLVTLDSFNGIAHFNSVAPGDVNFISGVYDGSTLINNQTALTGASNIQIGHSPN